jgi:excisionase family DNA binding protein
MGRTVREPVLPMRKGAAVTDLLRALVDALAADREALERLRELLGVPDSDEPEPWIVVADAAAHIGCKPQRIYDLVHAGRIPCHRDGSRLLFRRSALDDWLLDSGRSADTVVRTKGGRATRERPRP